MNVAHEITSTAASRALVLMGGGARTAYQVGVLRAIAGILGGDATSSKGRFCAAFPFQILLGTSAGAINAAYLASRAADGCVAFLQLSEFWKSLRSSDIYDLQMPAWVRYSRLVAAWNLSRNARKYDAVLNTLPLRNTLQRVINFDHIAQALNSEVLSAFAVTASSYSSGIHWTFCHTAKNKSSAPWHRPGRGAEFQPIAAEHLIASSAIPFIFPATPLWVNGRKEFFGDGSMRQSSPLAAALHLGASKVLVVGVGQPQRASFAGDNKVLHARPPSLGGIAGHAMASVFHDTLLADVEQTQRINQMLRPLPAAAAALLPYRMVDVLAIQPSQSVDALAYQHIGDLPSALRYTLDGLGALSDGGAALASYLLFEPAFTQALMQLGEDDAMLKKEELKAFFEI